MNVLGWFQHPLKIAAKRGGAGRGGLGIKFPSTRPTLLGTRPAARTSFAAADGVVAVESGVMQVQEESVRRVFVLIVFQRLNWG